MSTRRNCTVALALLCGLGLACAEQKGRKKESPKASVKKDKDAKSKTASAGSPDSNKD